MTHITVLLKEVGVYDNQGISLLSLTVAALDIIVQVFSTQTDHSGN